MICIVALQDYICVTHISTGIPILEKYQDIDMQDGSLLHQ